MDVPPPYIYDLYVVEYALVDDSIVFEQCRTLNVDGEWLGRVPCLAICQDFDTLEYSIQHCAADWELLGVATGYESVEKVKERVERSYHGIRAKWIRAETTFEDARALYEADLRADSCSFCGRTPFEMRRMVATEDHSARICDDCIDRYYKLIHDDDMPDNSFTN